MDAYRALFDLQREGKVKAVGVGAKDWKIIRRIAEDVPLDWVMIANSMTVKSHAPELLNFIIEMEGKGVYVINSAVFHSGFLVGSNHFDYRLITPGSPDDDILLEWRKAFFDTCRQFDVQPAEACVQFALQVPGVRSIALNTTRANRVKENIALANVVLPAEFWEALKAQKLITFNL